LISTVADATRNWLAAIRCAADNDSVRPHPAFGHITRAAGIAILPQLTIGSARPRSSAARLLFNPRRKA